MLSNVYGVLRAALDRLPYGRYETLPPQPPPPSPVSACGLDVEATKRRLKVLEPGRDIAQPREHFSPIGRITLIPETTLLWRYKSFLRPAGGWGWMAYDYENDRGWLDEAPSDLKTIEYYLREDFRARLMPDLGRPRSKWGFEIMSILHPSVPERYKSGAIWRGEAAVSEENAHVESAWATLAREYVERAPASWQGAMTLRRLDMLDIRVQTPDPIIERWIAKLTLGTDDPS